MALAAIKIWGAEILTKADLNAEFANIRNNALALISPLTGDLAAGGFGITGLANGNQFAPSISFTSNTDVGIWCPGGDAFGIALGGVDAFQLTLNAGVTLASITSTESGAVGPAVQLFHNSSTPAAADITGRVNFIAADSAAAARIMGVMGATWDDPTTTSMDSSLFFQVSNAVNAGNVNTTATLSSLGVWTDASAAANKTYVGDLEDVLGKLKNLKLGVYHGVGVPKRKIASAEKHYSPTAEDFWDVFKLGVDPGKGAPGIAAKDVGWIAVKGLLELEQRVVALEK